MQFENKKNMEISFLCVICTLEKRQKVMDILESYDSLFHLVSSGKGPASSKMLNYLGLSVTEKVIFFKILTTDKARRIINALGETLQFSKPGNGTAFLAKVQHICFHRPIEFSSDMSGGVTGQTNSSQNLIFVVLNRGYSEEVMEAARTAGVKGGIVLNAQGYGAANLVKFLGVSIIPKKEIMLLVTDGYAASTIMSDIAEKAGPAIDACAVSFSLPLNAVNGLQITDIE